MASEVEYNGGPGLYTQEDFSVQKRNFKKYYIIMACFILAGIIFWVQPWFSAWYMVIICFIVAIGFQLHIMGIKDHCREMALIDALYRAFSEHFEMESIEYVPELDIHHYVDQGKDDIAMSELETDKYKEGFFESKVSVVLPKFRVVGRYQGVLFMFDQYKIYEVTEQKNYSKENNDVSETMSKPKNMLIARLKDNFDGSVDIQSKSGGIIGKIKGYNAIEVEDIEFNKMFNISTSKDVGAFRLLTPVNIITIKELYEGLKSKKNKKPEMHILFKDGYFYNKKYAVAEIKSKTRSTNKIGDISKFQKECTPIIEEIKYYIEKMKFDSEHYTMG